MKKELFVYMNELMLRKASGADYPFTGYFCQHLPKEDWNPTLRTLQTFSRHLSCSTSVLMMYLEKQRLSDFTSDHQESLDISYDEIISFIDELRMKKGLSIRSFSRISSCCSSSASPYLYSRNRNRTMTFSKFSSFARALDYPAYELYRMIEEKKEAER